MFTLTAHDTTEAFDEVPESLMPLAAWLDATSEGASPFPLDPFEGIGIALTDGDRSFRSVAWGAASDVAEGCRHVIERLCAGQTALFRSSYLGSPVYLWFSPQGADIRCGRAPLNAPNTVFPYAGSPTSSTCDQIDALYAWVQGAIDTVDKGKGQVMVCPREPLLNELRVALDVATRAAVPVQPSAPSDAPAEPSLAAPAPAGQAPVAVRLGTPTVHRIELIRGLRALTLEDYASAKETVAQLEQGATVELTPHSPQALDNFRDQSPAWGLQLV
jgi:hypothetical protein